MYALGGINEKNINKLKILKTHGFGPELNDCLRFFVFF